LEAFESELVSFFERGFDVGEVFLTSSSWWKTATDCALCVDDIGHAASLV